MSSGTYSPVWSPDHDVYSPTHSSYNLSRNTRDRKSFIKPAPIKLDNLERLEGQTNYEDWASQMSMAFTPIGVYDIVINGVQPALNATEKELEAHEVLSNHAMLVLIQVISKPILKKISKLSTPHEIWKALRETYYRDNAFSFVHQVADLCLLSTQLEKDNSVVDFMEKFDDQWTRVYQMTAGPDPYQQKFCAFLEEDYAKRDFLLAALSKHYPNPVDNLTTKLNLSYAELKHHIRALVSNGQLGQLSAPIPVVDTALVTEGRRARRRQSYRARQNQAAQQNAQQNQTAQQFPVTECSYCKKHGHNAIGYEWQQCRKLKREQKCKRNHTANNNNNQQNPNQNQNTGLIAEVRVTAEQNVSTPIYTWKLDTCASAHMTSDIGVFEHIQPHQGVVGVRGGGTLLAEGIGSVLLNCILPDGISHLSQLNAVLYIPTLGHSLVS